MILNDDDDVDVDCGSNNQILVRCEIESGHIQINPRVREGKDWIAAISKTPECALGTKWPQEVKLFTRHARSKKRIANLC